MSAIERLRRCGPAALDDADLMSVVLGVDTPAAAHVISCGQGLQGLVKESVDAVAVATGLKPGRSARLLAALELGRRSLKVPTDRPKLSTPSQMAAYLQPEYGAAALERFGIVILNTKHRVLAIRVLSVGSLNATVVHPREVFRAAAALSASAIVLFHNHPSDDPMPSADDLALTTRLVQAGTVMGIDVVDHLILAGGRYFSFVKAGRMSEVK